MRDNIWLIALLAIGLTCAYGPFALAWYLGGKDLTLCALLSSGPCAIEARQQ